MRLRIGSTIAFSFLVLALAGIARAQNTIADSLADWSTTGTQGEKNWYYGYYSLTDDQTNGDGVYSVDDFSEFFNDGTNVVDGTPGAISVNQWNGTFWDLNSGGNNPWTELGAENLHPNGINFADEHWPIRRWVSDGVHAGAAIRWHTRKVNLNGAGVTGVLFVNGEQKDIMAIEGNDGAGVTRLVPINLKAGDIIELALTPVGPSGDTTDGADGSANRLEILDAIPDSDGDGKVDTQDNCLNVANPGQEDGDGDGIGSGQLPCGRQREPERFGRRRRRRRMR
jgi:hypothetical protein